MNSSKFIWRKVFIIAAMAAGTANAQTPQLVEVSLTNIKVAIAKDLQTDVERIPLMVKVPADTARSVCNVTAEALAPRANSGVPSCPADRTSAALNDAVRQEIGKGGTSK